jgi:hypothetical protein
MIVFGGLVGGGVPVHRGQRKRPTQVVRASLRGTPRHEAACPERSRGKRARFAFFWGAAKRRSPTRVGETWGSGHSIRPFDQGNYKPNLVKAHPMVMARNVNHSPEVPPGY